MHTSTITPMNKAMNWVKKPVLALVLVALVILAISLVLLPQKADAAVTYVVNADGTVTTYGTTTPATKATTTPKSIFYTPYTYYKTVPTYYGTTTSQQATQPYVYYKTVEPVQPSYTGYVNYPTIYWQPYAGANALGTNATSYGTNTQYQYPTNYGSYQYGQTYNPYQQNNSYTPSGFSQTNGYGNGGFKMTSGGY